MTSITYKNHARAKPLEAMAFKLASRYEPALEGLTRACVSKHILDERTKCRKYGIDAVVRAAMTRLAATNGKNDYWSYTRNHSIEVHRSWFFLLI